MKNGEYIIDDFLKPLREIVKTMKERTKTHVQT